MNRSSVLILGAFFAGLLAGFGDLVGAVTLAVLALFAYFATQK